MVAGKQLDVFEVAAEVERENKIAEFNKKRDEIQKQIDEIDGYEQSQYDSGMGCVEDRNERNYLQQELLYINSELEKLYNKR